MNYPHISQMLFNTPLAITADKLGIIVSAMSDRFGIIDMENFQAQVGTTLPADSQEKGYEVHNGVGIIPIQGTLMHKTGNLRPASGATGYDGIRENFFAAMKDRTVRAVALDISSPGGHVSGCFDLAEAIYQSRGTKPIMAILTDSAYSAAYALASAADVICVPAEGGTGSIGCVAAHASYAGKLEKEGVKVTMVHFGARKVDLNEAQDISDPALRALQASVNKMGEKFVRVVARNRGLTIKQVRETEAGLFMGKDGVDAGLADAVLAPDHAFKQLVDSIS